MNNTVEIWKSIPGYGRWQVGTMGHVRHQDRNGNWHIVKPYSNHKGYQKVHLTDENGKRKPCRVHRLVAEAFIPNPRGFEEINHRDEDKTNNSAFNLEWVSGEQNRLMHKVMKEFKTSGESVAFQNLDDGCFYLLEAIN